MEAEATLAGGRGIGLPSALQVQDHSARTRFAALCVFVGIVFLIGGGSRGDIVSLFVLRPVSFLFLAYGTLALTRQNIVALGAPFWIACAMFLLAGLQLVPLPPEVWSGLPGREMVLEASRSVGLETVWRPLSMAPSRTLNTLFSLGVPLAMFALVAVQDDDAAPRLVWPLLAAGAATAVVSVLQVIGPPDGPLYFYRITNSGLAVGLFSNRNHNAIFLASLVPLLTYVALRFGAREGQPARSTVLAACLGSIVLIVPLVLVSGSRAGTALMLGVTLASALLYFLHQRSSVIRSKRPGGAIVRLAPVLIVAVLGIVAWLTYTMARSLAFDRFMRDPLDAGIRADALPLLWRLAETYFPVGSGFGSFEFVFKVVETDELLQPAYLNQAHNDVLQLLIEGGLAGGMILLVALLWLARAGWRSWSAFLSSARGGRGGGLALFAWLSLVTLLAGSILDYPLRVPSLMAAVVTLCCLIEWASKPLARQQR